MSNINKEKNFVSAVIYIKNNEAHIESFLTQLYELFMRAYEKFEIIFVNDNSIDSSIEVINQTCDKIKNCSVSIINMGHDHGLELSMNAGVDLSIGDFVFEFDSIYIDYDLTLITDIYFHSLKGYDIVSACPSLSIPASSKLFYQIFNKNSAGFKNIKTESFRILSRRAINRVHSINKTVPYRKAIYANCGLNTDHIEYKNDVHNKKVVKTRYRKTLALDSLMLFTNIAFKFSIILTSIMSVAMILIAVYSMVVFLSGSPVEGWTTTVLLLSFGFFGMFGMFAIVIKYLSLLLNLIFKKENYYIKSINKVTK